MVPGPAQRVRPGLRLLLDTLGANAPAFVLGRRMDVLAWNDLAEAVTGYTRTPTTKPGGTPSVPRQVFLDPAARELYPDWAAVAAETVAHLRLDAGRHPDDRQLAALVGELSLKDEDFGRLWADQEVREKSYGVKHIAHPVVGALVLPYETLTLPGDPDQRLVVYTPEPGSATAERIALLGSWSAAPAAPAS